jgi:uncharacterized membrane protein
VLHGFLLSGGVYQTVDKPGALQTLPLGINSAGQIVGGYTDERGGARGFVLSSGIYQAVAVPGAEDSTLPWGINDAGQVVGYYRKDGFSPLGFLFSGGNYTTFSVPGSIFGTVARGINSQGDIAGDYFGGHGFVLSGGNYNRFDEPGGFYTEVYGINDAGQIVGDDGKGGFVATPAVPEPASLLMCLIGALGLLGYRLFLSYRPLSMASMFIS